MYLPLVLDTFGILRARGGSSEIDRGQELVEAYSPRTRR